MIKLRTILAENLKAYRNEMGLSQLKLADLVDTAPNYIAMIEAEKRFPTDTMLEKIAAALEREPCELFAITPIHKHWQETLLAELAEFISAKLQAAQNAGS
ncbi:MAG: helix-turn-helix domain-containing protein [Treponema sp.]|jgi:transcriptional regulator with XRE-family HTH domain|nr:helix-turn-helix domain-containing protein [Treponema sp.]